MSDPATSLAVAQTLPSDVLAIVFQHLLLELQAEETAGGPEADQFMHGGREMRWNSNEHLGQAVRGVCKGWEDAAIIVQYRSIAVIGIHSAVAFLDTVRKHPERGRRVRSLVVGLGSPREGMPLLELDIGALSDDSLKLVDVVRVCSNVLQLQVRPLASASRTSLLVLIPTLPLTTLVCTPRTDAPGCTWCREQWQSSDLRILASPTIVELELDFWTTADRDAEYETPTPSPPPPGLSPLALQKARIRVNTHEKLLAELILASPSLRWLDFYTEYVVFDMYGILLPATATLEHLSFLANPDLDGTISPGSLAVDRLLPACDRLQKLVVSANDLSPDALRNLPSSLRTVEVYALTEERGFHPSAELFEILRDPGLRFSLDELIVHDGLGVWEAEKVEVLETLCTSRGIRFRFLPDDEEELVV